MRSGCCGTARKAFLGRGPALAVYRPAMGFSWPSGGAGAFCLKARMRAEPSWPRLAASCFLYSSLVGDSASMFSTSRASRLTL